MTVPRQTSEAIFVWMNRALVGLLVYLAMEMRADIKTLSEKMPMVQEQIRTLQDDNGRLKNKVFSLLFMQPAKREDLFDIKKHLKLLQ